MIAQLKKVFVSHFNPKSLTQVAAIALVSTLALAPLARAEEPGLAPPATSDVSNEPAPSAPEAAPHMDTTSTGMGSPEAQPEPEHTARPKKSKKHTAKKKAGKKAKKGKKSAKHKKKKKKHTTDY